jgi:tetratricopeptide (TPR) repeat protein
LQFVPILIGVYLAYLVITKIPMLIYGSGMKELLQKKDYEKGLLKLERAVSLGVKPMAEVRAAYAELKFGDIKKARLKLNMVLLNNKIKRVFKNEARCIMSIVHLNLGEIEEANEIMGKLYDEGFRNTNYYATYGYLAILSKNPELYNKINDEAYDYNSDSPVILDNYAFCRYLDGDCEKASEIYEKLMEKEPSFPEAYYNYALVLIKLGNREKAAEMLEKALTKDFFGITTIKREKVGQLLDEVR